MAAIDRDAARTRILARLERLIALRTAYPPGDSSALCDYLRNELSDLGYEPETYTSAPGLENVVARLGTGERSLVFNAHIDTVAPGDAALWTSDPFRADIRNGRVFGLGAANCKGSAAVQLWLAGELATQPLPEDWQVAFTFVTDEESLGGGGMRYLREVGAVRPDRLLLGAPTDNALIVAERGVLWVEITTLGQPAHAGRPGDGVNAIERMMRVLEVVRRELATRLASRRRDGMASTFNLGTIAGGVNNNVVPARCTATVDRRLLPGETVEAAFDEIAEIVASAGLPDDALRVGKLRGTNGFTGSPDGPLVKALARSIEAITGAPAEFTTAIGVSDGRYFADDGIEIVNFSPGSGAQGHAVDEWVSVDALVESAAILARCMDELMLR